MESMDDSAIISEDRYWDLRSSGMSPYRIQHGDLRLGRDRGSPRVTAIAPIARYYRAGKLTVRQRDAADKLHALWSRSGYDGWRGCVPEPGAFVDTSKAGRANRHPGGGPGAAEYMAAMAGLSQIEGLLIRQVVLYGEDLSTLLGPAILGNGTRRTRNLRPFEGLLRSTLDVIADRLGI